MLTPEVSLKQVFKIIAIYSIYYQHHNRIQRRRKETLKDLRSGLGLRSIPQRSASNGSYQATAGSSLLSSTVCN